MTTDQAAALVKLLELTVHSQIHAPHLAHEYKLQLLDALNALKKELGLELQPENEPE